MRATIHDQYQPHIQPVGGPNRHLCTGNCKDDSCDSQGFCIDDGCGSVIHGGSQCPKRKTKTKKHHERTLTTPTYESPTPPYEPIEGPAPPLTAPWYQPNNTIHPTTPEENLYNRYTRPQPISEEPFGPEFSPISTHPWVRPIILSEEYVGWCKL